MGHTHSLNNSEGGVWRHTRDLDRADIKKKKKTRRGKKSELGRQEDGMCLGQG